MWGLSLFWQFLEDFDDSWTVPNCQIIWNWLPIFHVRVSDVYTLVLCQISWHHYVTGKVGPGFLFSDFDRGFRFTLGPSFPFTHSVWRNISPFLPHCNLISFPHTLSNDINKSKFLMQVLSAFAKALKSFCFRVGLSDGKCQMSEL